MKTANISKLKRRKEVTGALLRKAAKVFIAKSARAEQEGFTPQIASELTHFRLSCLTDLSRKSVSNGHQRFGCALSHDAYKYRSVPNVPFSLVPRQVSNVLVWHNRNT
jgi:hypothetical protein